ncbi:MAG: gamma-glutamyltransferase [Armatimonadetes bacterium]|nr:gamma-glutamyltransferase [Armatimonadota bacterium]
MTITTTMLQHSQSELSARGGLVTANHRLAAETGAAMLAGGGNAVDAAAAASFAIGVVEPAMSGMGGRGYMVIYFTRDGSGTVIDGHERAPLGARADMFKVEDARQVPTQGWGPLVPVVGAANSTGHLAAAVPGVVGAIATAHRRYGRLPLKTVLEPAMALAEEGFEVSVPLATTIAMNRSRLARFAASAAIFLRNGHPPVPGDRLVQPDLARSLRLMAEHGADEFYTGSIARAIAAEMERAGGLITLRDLAEFRPRVWERPLAGSYRGHRLLTVPEATGGITLVQIMNLLEGFDLATLDPLGACSLHLLLEACRIAFRDRLAVIDDPAFTPVPYAGLGSEAFADARRRIISRERALEDVTPADPWPYDGDAAAALPGAHAGAWRAGDQDTTHFCAVDRDRTVVSMTQSIIDAFGSGVVVPGTGILLNSAMHNFNPVPGQLGSIAPWKRSVHNGTPVIVLRPDGTPCLAIGGAGGTKIITGVAQILVNVLDRHWKLQDAVEAPRVHNEGWESQVDGRVPVGVVDELRRMGHSLEVVMPRFARPGFSRINGIAAGPDGTLSSGVDPFSDAGAAAVPA